eukprot:m.265789 g.265789  ORF g.265789 m.265789 type:complete len:909 (+) comp29555_c0_seq1:3-2729(+)
MKLLLVVVCCLVATALGTGSGDDLCGDGLFFNQQTQKCEILRDTNPREVAPSLETRDKSLYAVVADDKDVVFEFVTELGAKTTFSIKDLNSELSRTMDYLEHNISTILTELEANRNNAMDNHGSLSDIVASNAVANSNAVSTLQAAVSTNVATAANNKDSLSNMLSSAMSSTALSFAATSGVVSALSIAINQKLEDRSRTTSSQFSSAEAARSDLGEHISNVGSTLTNIFSSKIDQLSTTTLAQGTSLSADMTDLSSTCKTATAEASMAFSAGLQYASTSRSTMFQAISQASSGSISALSKAVSARVSSAEKSIAGSGTTLGTVSNLATSLSSSLSTFKKSVQSCAVKGQAYDETADDCVGELQPDGSSKAASAASCSLLKALNKPSDVYWVNREQVYCEMSGLGEAMGKSATTAFISCTAVRTFFQAKNKEPISGVYYIVPPGQSSAVATHCDLEAYEGDRCRSEVAIMDGKVKCANLNNGDCTVECSGSYAIQNSVKCVGGYLQGTAQCGYFRDELNNYDQWTQSGTSLFGAGFRIPSGNAHIISKQSFNSRPNGVTIEVRLKQIDGHKECTSIQYGRNTGRHHGHNWGQGWWGSFIGYGTDNYRGYNQQRDNTGTGTWRTYRFTRNGNTNKVYQDGVLKYTWTDSRYNSGKVSAGWGCVNTEYDYFAVIEKDLGSTPFASVPAAAPTTFGGAWTLAAKVTSDFEWACPDRGGANCMQSAYKPVRGNLFAPHHQTSWLSLDMTTSSGTGLSLKKDALRSILAAGYKQIRFVFADTDWEPSADGWAAMTSTMASRIFDDNNYAFLNGADFKFNVVTNRKGKSWSAETICWGQDGFRGGYEGGLFMGKKWPSSGLGVCHIWNSDDKSEIQLKSHITQTSGNSWYAGQHGFLNSGALQAVYARLAVFVR